MQFNNTSLYEKTNLTECLQTTFSQRPVLGDAASSLPSSTFQRTSDSRGPHFSPPFYLQGGRNQLPSSLASDSQDSGRGKIMWTLRREPLCLKPVNMVRGLGTLYSSIFSILALLAKCND
jgi:hypothetical protein